MSELSEESAIARPAPLARGVPILGNGPDLVRDALGTFVRCYHELGAIYRLRGPGRRYTVLAGPKANAFLLRGGERYFDSAAIYRRLAGELRTPNYPVATTGERHRHLRRTLRPAFSREAISHYIPGMVEVADRIVRAWQPGQRLRVPEVMRALLAEQLGLAMANRSLGERLPDAVAFARVSVGAGLGSYPAIARFWPPYLVARRRMFAFLGEVIADHRREPPGAGREPDLIDLLLAAADHTGVSFTEQDVIGNAQMIYSNALLYAAPACAFLLYGLLKNPDVLASVVAEVDARFGEDPLTMATFSRMPLLQGATKESFRLYPIALTVPRIATAPFEFEGHRVEAGEAVLIAVTVCHFLPECFPDPYAFDPTRYSEPRNEHRQPGLFAPFGLGSHPCAGAGLVEVLVMATVATLLRAVSVRLDPPDYVLRRVPNPFAEPEERFTVGVVEQRPWSISTAAPRDEVDLSAAMPSLSGDLLARVRARAQTMSYSAGANIVRQGDVADRFYILTAGRVEVLHEQRDGAPQLLRYLERGAYFGEIGLLHDVPRTATVRAVSAATVIALDRADFREIVAESDLTAAEISAVVQRRLMSSRLAEALPSLTAEQIARVAPRFEMRRERAGATIIRQGDPADWFYILARGEVDVVNHHPGGKDILLASLGPGDYFGEVGLVHDQPRMATVRARTDVEMMTLDREAFRDLLSQSEQTSQQIASVISERLAAEGQSRPVA